MTEEPKGQIARSSPPTKCPFVPRVNIGSLGDKLCRLISTNYTRHLTSQTIVFILPSMTKETPLFKANGVKTYWFFLWKFKQKKVLKKFFILLNKFISGYKYEYCFMPFNDCFADLIDVRFRAEGNWGEQWRRVTCNLSTGELVVSSRKVI